MAEEAATQAAPRVVAPPLPTVSKPPEPDSQTSAISQALDEVSQVVEALRKALDQMEEALELVELAERQKLADEQELDSLRRALRQLQRPRGQRSHDDEGRRS
ncbi:MAG: hypothetical protein KIS67_24000 [Verrucomicrobiae bacterium]|nr:hypothetical protein [Verrucomicrobiae bacterium]